MNYQTIANRIAPLGQYFAPHILRELFLAAVFAELTQDDDDVYTSQQLADIYEGATDWANDFLL